MGLQTNSAYSRGLSCASRYRYTILSGVSGKTAELHFLQLIVRGAPVYVSLTALSKCFLHFKQLQIQSINSLHKWIYVFFIAYNADAVIDAGADKVIFLHHTAGKDAGFDLLVFSITDSKTHSWMFVLIAHDKAPFIVGVAAGIVKHPQAAFDYAFLVVKVD